MEFNSFSDKGKRKKKKKLFFFSSPFLTFLRGNVTAGGAGLCTVRLAKTPEPKISPSSLGCRSCRHSLHLSSMFGGSFSLLFTLFASLDI